METIYPCVAGLDIHKKNIVVCLRQTRSDGSLQEDVRTFSTMTADLFELADWLSQQRVTHVAMESTGVLWKPIWNILEGYSFPKNQRFIFGQRVAERGLLSYLGIIEPSVPPFGRSPVSSSQPFSESLQQPTVF